MLPINPGSLLNNRSTYALAAQRQRVADDRVTRITDDLITRITD